MNKVELPTEEQVVKYLITTIEDAYRDAVNDTCIFEISDDPNGLKYYVEVQYCYDVDYATSFGDYIDDFWNTCNDWCEGQEVHITHWAEIPKPDFDKISLEG